MTPNGPCREHPSKAIHRNAKNRTADFVSLKTARIRKKNKRPLSAIAKAANQAEYNVIAWQSFTDVLTTVQKVSGSFNYDNAGAEASMLTCKHKGRDYMTTSAQSVQVPIHQF